MQKQTEKCRVLRAGIVLLSATRLISAQGADVHVVPPGTPGHEAAEPYDNWGNAATNIQTAVAFAEAGGVTEVRVSNGWYRLPQTVDIRPGLRVSSFGGGALDVAGTVIDGDGRGGFIMRHAEAVIEGFTITNCYLNNSSGSAVRMLAGGTLRNCDIAFNRQSGYSSTGGAVGMSGGVVADCLFRDNTAVAGGGVCLLSGTMLVTNCTFRGNRAGYGGGGTIKGGIGQIVDCSFTNNMASTGGGGFSTHASTEGAIPMTAMVERCVFVGNISTNNGSSGGSARGGGGVRFGQEATATLRNCLIMHNRAIATYCGGVYFNGNSRVQVENCTIVSNQAVSRGGGLAIINITNSLPTTVRNTIIHSNQSGSADSDNLSGTVQWFTWTNNCIATTLSLNTYGSGNMLDSAPRFVSPADNDWHLQPASPCVNTGVTLEWMRTDVDLDGNRRMLYDMVDMGCFETMVPYGTTLLIR